MADDTELAPTEELEPSAASAEGAETADPPGDPDPIEEFARTELGWAPQNEFRGPPEEWKPAADFIKAGREITRSVSKKLNSVEDQLTRLTRTTADMTARAVAEKAAERDAYWQGIQRKAVDEGDHELAERAVEERVKLKAQTAAPPQPPLPQETNSFIEKHKSWFGVDPLATSRAKRLAAELAEDGYDTAAQLAQVERAIRKEFPEHFAAPAKTPPGVQTAQNRNTNQGSRKKGYADMPPESRAMADDYEKRHGVPKESFAASYWADQNERKVG